MHLVEAYLRDMQAIHASGSAVKETSYYGPLERLLNAAGVALKPRVRAVVHPRNQGAGIPDLALYSADQFAKTSGATLLPGQLPARGVVEVKGLGDDVAVIACSEQVRRYGECYGQVLVTNYRNFLLLARGADGTLVSLEAYTLAPGEAAFWAADPRALVDTHGAPLFEYLKRVLLHATVLSNPADVAWFLAS